jgi:hypothetical protein
MIKQPGLYIQRDPLRIVAAAETPEGGLAVLEFPLTPEQACGFSVALARTAARELSRIEEFDAEFLAGLKIANEPKSNIEVC